MKKILLASTMLAAFATVADAETGVKISGYGRMGLTHDSTADAETTVHTRLRLNIDATTETDSGAVFGGRIRMQSTNGSSAGLSQAMAYVEYEGLRVEAGNVNTAFDSAALIYDSELGLTDSSFGDARTSFFSFSSTGNVSGSSDGTGVYASYSMSGFSGQVSYVDDEHYTGLASDAETSLALSYTLNDQFTVSAAGVWNGAGIAGNDAFFIGGAYKLSDVATVGLNYIDEGVYTGPIVVPAGTSYGKTVVLYGNYTMDAITVRGYIANNDFVGNTDDLAFGIGADYDLGGARLSGGIHRGYDDNTFADVGVRFNF